MAPAGRTSRVVITSGEKSSAGAGERKEIVGSREALTLCSVVASCLSSQQNCRYLSSATHGDRRLVRAREVQAARTNLLLPHLGEMAWK